MKNLDFHKKALQCLMNGVRLIEAATTIWNETATHRGDRALSSFVLDTASEELMKGMSCFFFHVGWLKPEIQIFKRHQPKAVMFILWVKYGLTVESGVPLIGDRTLADFFSSWQGKVEEELKEYYNNYKQKREGKLYIDESWSNPIDHAPSEEELTFQFEKNEMSAIQLAQLLSAPISIESNLSISDLTVGATSSAPFKLVPQLWFVKTPSGRIAQGPLVGYFAAYDQTTIWYRPSPERITELQSSQVKEP